MKVVTAEKMRQMDSRAVQDYGIPGVVLMENAGLRVVEVIQGLQLAPGSRVVIVSGKGNNGGDGFVIARHLISLGFRVDVFAFAAQEEYHGDALVNFLVLKHMGAEPIHILKKEDLFILEGELAHAHLVVDALLGTGLASQVRGLMGEAIDCINRAEKMVVSVDIPSGVHGNTGEVLGRAVRAHKTVTFALPKQGLFLYPGAEYAGSITVGDISIPGEVMEDPEVQVNLITEERVRVCIPQRKPDSHKGTCGRVLILGGSPGLTGAPAMAAQAALRSGAGLITAGIPAGLNSILESKLTEVMTYPLPETLNQGLSSSALEPVLNLLKNYDAAGIGPGIHPDREAYALVKGIIRETSIPLVLDAGALTLLSGKLSVLKEAPCPLVLTPHPGEMARLLGCSVQDVEKNRLQAAQKFAETWKVVLVLKGARTAAALPSGEVYLNITGNPGMASGGTGDVLTGLIASLMGQGLSAKDAALAGVYIHGLAGDRAAEKVGEAGLTATDLISELPAAIKGLSCSLEGSTGKHFYFNRDLL